ncbi:MAG TPA: methyltransferase [Verrucomicrobiae bacterium]|nr:methyltransferase [Verrucomicrobiae bacterium]
MSSDSTSVFPLTLGTEREFATARAFFSSAGFDEPGLCRLLGLADMSDLGKVEWEKCDKSKFSEALWACVEVFLRGNTYSDEALSKAWGAEPLQTFEALGLVRPSRKCAGSLFCPIWLYPMQGFLIASDRRTDPEAQLITTADDVVFPGIYAGTLRFLRLLPDARGGEALDLCGGTGIGALILAKTARHAVTADLTARSAFFAEFNSRLSGVPVESLCGDLYAPVPHRLFDLITAHPPFVPSIGKTMIYRDAGDAGEDVSRGVIAGLAEHLRPGGTCMVLCVACDTTEAPFEQRAFAWLGEHRQEFEVLYGLEKIMTVEGVVSSMAKRGQNMSEEDAASLLHRLRSLQTKQFVYGALFIRRLKTPTAPPPFRFRISPSATAREFERLFAWRRWCSGGGLEQKIAQCKPTLRRDVELNVRHLVSEGELVPAEFVFSIDEGVRSAFRPSGWVVPLLAQLNGQRTVAEVFARFQGAEELPKGFQLSDFTSLVQQMIEKGFFDLDLAGSSGDEHS